MSMRGKTGHSADFKTAIMSKKAKTGRRARKWWLIVNGVELAQADTREALEELAADITDAPYEVVLK